MTGSNRIERRHLPRQQGLVAEQDLRGLWPRDDVAPQLGQELGRGEVLQRRLPPAQSGPWHDHARLSDAPPPDVFDMNPLNQLPGFQRSPPGLEWALLRRLPAILVIGTVVPIGWGLICWWVAPTQTSAAEDRDLLMLTYWLIGLVMLHWTLVFTAAIGCVIVWLMKGPAYVADAYPPPEREQPE
jgi:hypothetical protein